MEKFKDKITIITGGASGIGRAVGEEMARRGAVLVLADRNGELLEETVESINLSGGKAKAVILDVTDAGTVKTMIEDTAREYGRLDYLFNNAGIGISGEVRDLELTGAGSGPGAICGNQACRGRAFNIVTGRRGSFGGESKRGLPRCYPDTFN